MPYGRIVKTVSILRYLHDEQHRRHIQTQVNKGESLHALRRMIFFANQGEIRRTQPDDQDLQGECLTLITNAVIAWNTVYIAHAIDHLNQNGTSPEDRHLSRLSPGGHHHISFHGKYDFTNPKPLLNGNLRPLNVEPDRYVSSI
ncbi:MAG: Tn3 family transposase [Acidimicrobiales bacterium]